MEKVNGEWENQCDVLTKNNQVLHGQLDVLHSEKVC